MRKILKAKIGLEETKIWYNKKIFKNRVEAVEGIINHLQRMLDADVIYNE